MKVESRVETAHVSDRLPDSSPQALLRFLRERLPDRRFIVASNREPYVHRKIHGEIRCDCPAGGVTSALDPLLRAVDGVWVAWGSGEADRQVVDKRDRLRVPPACPSYTLRRVWLSPEEVEQYYHGYSNRFLWPLCHMTLDRVVFRQGYWEAYQKIN
jgi:trehalose 6-phosphate synthase